MAKTQFNAEQLKTEAVKPLYAVAGATELAVQYARGYATEAQKATEARFDKVQTQVTGVRSRVSKVEFDSKALQSQAKGRVEELRADAKDAQVKFEARLAEIQKEANELPAKLQAALNDAIEELNGTYADLATRGEKFVAAIRKDGVKAVAKVKAKKVAKKAPAKKAAAKKAPAKKTTAKKAPAKKAAKKAS